MNIGPINLTNLKEKFTEKFSELLQKIQDSATYNTVLEYYQNLSPKNQRNIFLGIVGFFLLIVLLYPMIHFISSSREFKNYLEQTQSVHNLSQLNLGKSRSFQMSEIGSFEQIKGEMQRFLKRFKLVESQMVSVDSYQVPEDFGPASGLKSLGFSISLKTLNLNQVVDIGQRITRLSPQFKLLGLEMRASPDKKFYFDVLFKVVKFGPDEKVTQIKRKTKRKGKR